MVLIIYVFFSTSPKNKRKREVTKINLVIFSVGICGCAGISLYSYFTTGKSVDSAWWPVAAFFGSIIVFSAILCIGGIYRNLIHFKTNA
jgi:O-antigen/teichoic acid export membrane protein